MKSITFWQMKSITFWQMKSYKIFWQLTTLVKSTLSQISNVRSQLSLTPSKWFSSSSAVAVM